MSDSIRSAGVAGSAAADGPLQCAAVQVVGQQLSVAASLTVARLPAGNFSSGLTWASPPGGAAEPTPTEGRSSVSTEQRENLDAVLRQSAFPAGSDVNEQRRLLRELIP